MKTQSLRDQEKGKKKAFIIESADRLFSLSGYEDTTMNDLVRETNLTKRTLYNYFVNKEDLFFAVILNGYQKLWQAVSTESEKGQTGLEKLELSCNAFYTFYTREPGILTLMGKIGHVRSQNTDIELPHQEKFYAHNKVMFAAINQIFILGKADGSLRDDIDAPQLMGSFVFTLTGFFYMYTLSGQSYLKFLNVEENDFIKTTLLLLIDTVKK
ncbi:MAG: TetR/AcrR family transcriptional regulator [Firmicutes bacterium HGW-Firmicutes-4]|jgi:AcrR family transcriptional regulator|nr:MAG: TetR/AcrR family transcriptional regulator [Firmicutes bacterium HGW-Firmicutes-4]